MSNQIPQWYHPMQKQSIDAEGINRAPYSALAVIYDHVMNHVNYRKWAKYVHRLVGVFGNRQKTGLLDIACGTGRFLQEMHKLGYSGGGCDPSPEMLKIARKNLRNVDFFEDQLPQLNNCRNNYKIVTCLYDSINYLLERQELEQALVRIYDIMANDSLFIFDVVSDAHCRQYFQNFADNEVIDDQYAYHRESYYDRSQRIQKNYLKIFTPNGVYDEVHHQRIYDLETIKEMIRDKTDFRFINCYEDFSNDVATRNSGRIHFVLKKT